VKGKTDGARPNKRPERRREQSLDNILTLLISVLKPACELGWLARMPKIKKPRVVTFDRDFRCLRTTNEVPATPPRATSASRT
jgi:hypothetical protein